MAQGQAQQSQDVGYIPAPETSAQGSAHGILWGGLAGIWFVLEQHKIL